MDELVQLIIFIAIALVAMLGSGRKKPQQRRPQRPARRPPARPQGRAAPTSADRSREQLKEDLLDLLQGREPSSGRQPRSPPPPAPVPEATTPMPVTIDDEAQPIESLEPLDSTSHQEFHERYVDPVRRRVARQPSLVRRLTPRTAREAVIWKTIFDKPKGLE